MIRVVHYFAYGSNMHVQRLRARTPSSVPVATAVLPGYEIHCDKRGADRSAKCNVSTNEFADVPGVVFRVRLDELPALDRAEGSGYRRMWTDVAALNNGRHYHALVYVAIAAARNPDLRAFDWYKALVIAGARQHRLPFPHVARLLEIQSRPDSNYYRRRWNLRMLHGHDQAARRRRNFVTGRSVTRRDFRIVTGITARLDRLR